MPIFEWNTKFARSFLVGMVFTSVVPSHSLADDHGKEQPPSKPLPEKSGPASSGLTERERWLLDRVEQLEKRVAELESKSNAKAAAAVEDSPSQAIAGEPAAAAEAAVDPRAGAISSSAPPATPATTTESTANIAGTNSPAAPSTKQAQTTRTNAREAAPFAFADFTWLNGNARTKESPVDTKFFTPEVRADISYIFDFNHPKDATISGSSEVFRSKEVQVTQLGVGGDFHYDNVRARLMTQFGMYSFTTPRNDASPSRGQWDLDTAYRYVSEAYGGYHFNVLHGINVDAGIFMSYIGLFSYYNFDNWAYQPSFVSSNTPWFFNGVRVQIFPTEHLKIEPWFTNGWQSYGRFNHRPGFGTQILYRPNGWLSVLGNQYGFGEETLGVPGRVRYHSDDSIEIKYYDKPENYLDKMAFSLTGDIGCEHGGGVSCFGG